MKHLLSSILIATSVICLSDANLGSTSNTLYWNTNRVDTTEAIEEEISIENCTGFYLDDSNDAFWVIDTYGKNVIHATKENEVRIPIKETALPSDIVVDKDTLYIYDDLLQSVILFDKTGDFLSKVKVPLEVEEEVLWMRQSNPYLLFQTDQERTYLYNKNTKAITTVGFQLERLDLDTYDYNYRIDSDERGNSYYLAANIFEDTSILSGELTIIKTNAKKEPVGYFTIPTMDITGLADTFFQVSDDGICYFLYTMEEEYCIKRIFFRSEPYTYEEEIRQMISEKETEYKRRENSYADLSTTLSKKIVLQNVLEIINYTYSLKNTNIENSKDVEIPKEILYYKDFSDVLPEIKGIPYCWGGCNTLSKATSVYGTFPSALASGKNAGNTDTHGYLKTDSCGLDCSGYITAVFGIPGKKNTSMLLGLGKRVTDTNELSSMDFLLSPGSHVILLHEWGNDGFLTTSEAAVLEGKVVLKTRPLAPFLIQSCYQMRTVK